MSKSERKSVLPAAPAHGYEFGGPIGAFATSFGLPFVVYLFGFLCNDIAGCPVPSVLSPSTLSLAKLKAEVGWPKEGITGLGSWKVTGYVLAYYFTSLCFWAFLPGEEIQGSKLKSGARLDYKFNAFNSAVVIMVVAAAGTIMQGPDFALWTFIWDNYIQIITANLGVAFLLACFVYVRSFEVKPGNAENRELAAGGHSGNLIYDWFIGRELNPRITLPVFGTIDIKTFCELRPGMLGWVLCDLAFMAHQYKLCGSISDSMYMITAFQALYVFDALWMESAMLTQIDITTDGFGFMLAFGDLAWLPFIYSFQAKYLAVYPVHLGVTGIVGILAVQALGYYIFRASNNEKNAFRTNPDDPAVAHLSFIQTETGSKLITSGWWGTARHINYLGDWIMAWSYCLPTGIAGYVIQNDPFSAVQGGPSVKAVQGEARGWGMLLTYFYLFYFAVLLIHREMRDEEKCSKKYGKSWEEYKKKVPYRILPYVY
ncbi:MAG: erg24, C-14 sterol reductase [Icmadophila ericetorum]|nr:erg24, C-14 sterol reductase [Icmadophila ericetorum]